MAERDEGAGYGVDRYGVDRIVPVRMSGSSGSEPHEVGPTSLGGSQIRLGEDGRGVDDRLVGMHTDSQTAEICKATVASLHAALDEIEAAIWQSLETSVPSYGTLGESEVRDVRATIRLAARLFFSCVIENRRLTATERAEITEAGLKRAQQGIPLEANRNAIRCAVDVAQQVIHKLMLPRPPSHAVMGTGAMFSALATFAEEFAVAMSEGHAVHERRTVEKQEGRADAFVEGLLDGTAVDSPKLATAAGFQPDRGCQFVVAKSVRSPAWALRDRPPLLERVLEREKIPTACRQRRTPVDHAVLVLPDGSISTGTLIRRVSEAADSDGFVAIVERVSDLAAVAPRYRVLCELLPAIDALRPSPGLLEIEELLPWALICSVRRALAMECVRSALVPLPALPAEEAQKFLAVLRETVLLGKSVDDAAEVLGVSARTVYRRRQEFQKLSGRSFHNSRDVFLITQAIQLLDLGNLPPLGAPSWESSC